MSSKRKTTSKKQAAKKDTAPPEPAENVAPFMKVIREFREFSRTIAVEMNVLTGKVNTLQGRIDEYDKFFGKIPEKPPVQAPAPPLVASSTADDKKTAETDPPSYIKDGVKGLQKQK